MIARKVLQARQIGTRIVISLACGHVITRTASSYQRDSVERKEDCLACSQQKKGRR